MVYHRINRGVEGVQVLTKIFNQLFHDKAHAVYVYSDNLQLEVICFQEISYYIFLSVWLYSSLAPNINKIKQTKIKIGKILVERAIKGNVTCNCVWGFYKNDLRCVVWF